MSNTKYNLLEKRIDLNENWGGFLIMIKKEWLNKDERQIPFVVLEDRDDRILIQQLPQYKSPFRTFLHTESVLKEWTFIVDKDIQKYELSHT